MGVNEATEIRVLDVPVCHGIKRPQQSFPLTSVRLEISQLEQNTKQSFFLALP